MKTSNKNFTLSDLLKLLTSEFKYDAFANLGGFVTLHFIVHSPRVWVSHKT